LAMGVLGGSLTSSLGVALFVVSIIVAYWVTLD